MLALLRATKEEVRAGFKPRRRRCSPPHPKPPPFQGEREPEGLVRGRFQWLRADETSEGLALAHREVEIFESSPWQMREREGSRAKRPTHFAP